VCHLPKNTYQLFYFAALLGRLLQLEKNFVWAGGACGLLLDGNLTRKFTFERQIFVEQKPSNAKKQNSSRSNLKRLNVRQNQ
jgi:hypothetical protein